MLRAAKYHNGGFVLEQEGDSFTIAFYDPFDAVVFCLQVKQPPAVGIVTQHASALPACQCACLHPAANCGGVPPALAASLPRPGLICCVEHLSCAHMSLLLLQAQQALLAVHWPPGLDQAQNPDISSHTEPAGSRRGSSECLPGHLISTQHADLLRICCLIVRLLLQLRGSMSWVTAQRQGHS